MVDRLTDYLQLSRMNPRALYESDEIAWLQAPDSVVETTWVERKLRADARKLAEQISGFANGQPPGGLIVLGVADDGRLIGVDEKSDELLAKLASHLDGRTGKEWESRYVRMDDTGKLLFIYVPFAANRVLCLSDGSAFQRIGNITSRLTAEQILDLRDSRREVRFELKPITAFSEEAIDGEVATRFLEGVIARNHLTMPLTLVGALENKQLVTKSPTGELTLTVAGAIVLGRKPTESIPGARIRFFAFEGTEEKFGAERNVIRDRWFDGPLPKLVDEFHSFMQTQVRTFEYLGPSGTFVREPEYPEGTWQEAVVNALVHRSYTLENAWVMVRMFTDRLEIESPGGYPGANRPDDEGVFARPYPRNPVIADALQYLGLVWLAREGTRRMHDEMKKLGLPAPEFRDDKGSKVVVTLRNDIERRRARGGDDVEAQWGPIERLLDDDYAIVRWQGLLAWQNLASNQAIPPPSLITTAIGKLQHADAEISVDHKREILQLLQKLPDNVLRAPMVELTRRIVPHGLTIGEPTLDQQLSRLLARFDEPVDMALSYLEGIGSGLVEDGLVPPSHLDNYFLLLSNRLTRAPFPLRDWLEKVVAVSKRSKSPLARALFRTITGREPS